jgi:Putative auto-transporter adhesin, head GIN domain
MNVLIKVGAGMALLATLMTSGFYSYLKAEGSNSSTTSAISAADRTVKNETRSITSGITQIEISGPIEFKLTQGATPGLMVRAEQRFLSQISTDQSGNTLSISFKGRTFQNKTPIEVEVTLAELQKLTMRGSGDSNVTGFKGEQLQLSLNGSGDLNLQGEYQRVNANLRGSGDLNLNTGTSNSVELDIIGSGSITAKGTSKTLVTQLNGSGDMDADSLVADNVTVNLNGSGNTLVNAKQSVVVVLRGSGDVSVAGQPAQRNITKVGSGDVDFTN